MDGAPDRIGRTPGILARGRLILKSDRTVYGLVALHALAAVCALTATGAQSAFAYLSYLPAWPVTFFVFFPFLYGMLGVLVIVHRFDKRRSLAVRALLSEPRLAHFWAGLTLLFAIMIFHGTFTSFKNALPVWQGGFRFDVVQANIDHALHFGRDPWLYLHDLAGSGFVRAIVEWNYNQGWFILCFSTLFFVAVSYEARSIRTRYFLCYVLAWVTVGNVLAGLFLSAGPAFYGKVTGDAARFAGQLAFLADGRDWRHSAAAVQHYLWALHESGQPGLGSGISAFPSMHVSLVTLNALFLAERSRLWGILAFAYVALVLASSVYLAWHYAIDGYAAVLVTWALYAAVRWGFDRTAARRRTALPGQPAWQT